MKPDPTLVTRAQILSALETTKPREPIDDEEAGLDGLDRQGYFYQGYSAALREFAARLSTTADVEAAE